MAEMLGLRSRNSPSTARNIFRYPLQPCPRIAVVCDSIRLPSGCRRIPESGRVDLRSLRAETIAAPASWLSRLQADGWTPTFPIIVFTGARHGFLDNAARDQMWQRFGVPVFEQLLDDEDCVVASECEAHDGLHLEPLGRHTFNRGELLLNGRSSKIAARQMTGLCGCGTTGARITDARPFWLPRYQFVA
jgi:hypothetical protein